MNNFRGEYTAISGLYNYLCLKTKYLNDSEMNLRLFL